MREARRLGLPASSPPVRRRGLKLFFAGIAAPGGPSPPVRRRGLKPRGCLGENPRRPVASRAEAWIETNEQRPVAFTCWVASRAEAWIETTRMLRSTQHQDVASRAEAWIETWTAGNAASAVMASPPVRRRGLKPLDASLQCRFPNVASRAEAWIETALLPHAWR